ncbi:hypothetical protein BaRGS_00008238 [Batillaria attramentaria]|uniref:Uncharacterized protein n=1 Tax=Batillaria attramentaria TaxID=370345 RepID=A0ABD0LMH0_9CAEN
MGFPSSFKESALGVNQKGDNRRRVTRPWRPLSAILTGGYILARTSPLKIEPHVDLHRFCRPRWFMGQRDGVPSVAPSSIKCPRTMVRSAAFSSRVNRRRVPIFLPVPLFLDLPPSEAPKSRDNGRHAPDLHDGSCVHQIFFHTRIPSQPYVATADVSISSSVRVPDIV